MNNRLEIAKRMSQSRGYAELTSRLSFLLLVLFIYRLGAHIPVPGLNPERLSEFFSQHNQGLLGFFNMFSGGALSRLTVFALGIMPYISASIIIQLFSTVTPSLAQLRKEGESGQRRLNQYIRYATLVLATFQAIGMCKFLVHTQIAWEGNLHFYANATLTLVTGTVFLMWLGEQATERGIGNGISMIIFASIVSGLPSALGRTFEQLHQGQLTAFWLLFIALLIAAVIFFVVFIERAQRRIPIYHAQRQNQMGAYQKNASHLPLKLNMSGVIPPIFASSILVFLSSVATWFGQSQHWGILSQVSIALQRGQVLHMVLFAGAILFFCFFYTALVFNPKETADQLKRSNAYIPGIRPGKQTMNYIDTVILRLTFFGGLYITVICLLPEFLDIKFHVPFYFGGTSLLIIVVVVMDFMAQMQALLTSQQYDKIMKKNRGARRASNEKF